MPSTAPFGGLVPAGGADRRYIGPGFTRASLKLLGRVLPVARTPTILIILGCAGLGPFLASATGQTPLAGYLAASPSGPFAVLAGTARRGVMNAR